MIVRNFFLGILAFIFLEIYIGLAVVREFGFANAFFACVAAFVLGVGLFRTSSLRLTVGVAQAMREGKPPGLAALDGALIGLAGVFFLMPGFLSDVLALLLLVPPLRRWGAKRLVNTISIRQRGNVGRSSSANEDFDASSAVIDVDAVVIDDKHLPRGK